MGEEAAGVSAPNDPDIQVARDDAFIEPLPRPECEDCGDAATHVVKVDWRAAGRTFGVAVTCEPCGLELVDRLRSGLPGPVKSE